MALSDYFSAFGDTLPLLRTLVVLLLLILLFNWIIKRSRHALLQRATTKKHISNIEIFSRVIWYIVLVLALIIALLSYSGSWTGLGITLGLFSAALGFALQRPITGIAAWLMIVIKRPFDIGDRIILSGVRGDVVDANLTHVSIKEIGGIVAGEEHSGRIVLVPNSILFEQNITNYTAKNEHVLNQVSFVVTFDSDVDKAIDLVLKATRKHTIKYTSAEPYTRTFFHPYGITLSVRYMSSASRLEEVQSDITKEIYDILMKDKHIEFALPHTEVVLRQKEERKRRA